MRLFAPPPAAPEVEESQVAPRYEYWRWRLLYSTFVGYAVFYFVRKNLSSAFPLMEKDLGIDKAQLGGFLTCHGILYGLSKFLNGIWADRANARTFMAFGLFTSALCNLAFGFSSTLTLLGFLWVLNGWFQGMGFPPCARLLSHWFSPNERGTKWGLWNTSHQVGGALIMILGGYLGAHFGWRAVFWVPSLLSLGVSLWLLNRLRDTPASLGLPEVEVYRNDHTLVQEKGHDRKVFSNYLIWLICFGNFFVYVVRYVYFDWWNSFLQQQRHFTAQEAGWLTASFEVAGLVGSLLAGYWSDRWRRNSVCLVYLAATAVSIAIYSQLPVLGFWVEALAISAVGFFIYGPQFLVGVMVCDLAGKQAAASAIGLTGFFGYLSTVASGYGLGLLVDKYGWSVSFTMTLGCTLAAFLCFLPIGKKT